MKIFSPKISIIIPVYNGSNYLREAIDSALAQTYKNIEVIVVNDGSIDNSEEIALSYGKKIRYFKKENGGVATALNFGIEKMTGEYFSWLSHDDVYLSDKLQTQIDFLRKQKDKNIILYSDYNLIDENSNYIYGPIILDDRLLNEYPLLCLYDNLINGITLLIPKKLFLKFGYFDESLVCTQDYDLWFKMIFDIPFVHINKILVKTRIHSLQTSKTRNEVLIEGNKLWIKMMSELSKEKIRKVANNEFLFFSNMEDQLKNLPYKEAYEYAKNKKEEVILK